MHRLITAVRITLIRGISMRLQSALERQVVTTLFL
jgi:hypothetical protein